MDKLHSNDGGNLELKTKKTFERYLSVLDLNLEELKCKKILDIGAGPGEFATEAKRHGIDITSIDKVIGGTGVEKVTNKEITYVAGIAEELPFKDESFDLVVSVAAYNGVSLEDFVNRLGEVRRVLKSGGEYRFGPGIIELQISQNEKEEYRNISSKQPKEMTVIEEERKQLLYDLLVADQLIFYRNVMDIAFSFRQPLEENQRLTSNIDEWPPRVDNLPDDVIEYANEFDTVVRKYPYNLDPYQLDDNVRQFSLKIFHRFDKQIDYKELPNPTNKVFKNGYYVLNKKETVE